MLLPLIGYTISSIARRRKQSQPESTLPRLARISGIAFIVLLIAFLIGFVAALSQTSKSIDGKIAFSGFHHMKNCNCKRDHGQENLLHSSEERWIIAFRKDEAIFE